MTRSWPYRLAMVVAVTVVVAAGCGVPRDGRDRLLRPDQIAFDPVAETTSTTSTTTTSTTTTTIAPPPTTLAPASTTTTSPPITYPMVLYWVHNDMVVPVRRIVVADPTLDTIVGALSIGPDSSEVALGLRNALSGTTILSVSAVGGTATVELDASFLSLLGNEQVLALAQIVHTITGVPGIGLVRFQLAGNDLAVPRADGEPAKRPVSRDDYSPLVGPLETTTTTTIAPTTSQSPTSYLPPR